MSQKVVLAVAATAALVASTEAISFNPPPFNPSPFNPTRPFDEESMIGLPTPQWVMDQEAAQKINWKKVVGGVSTGLDLYGKAKGVGLFEEGDNYWEVGGGASNGGNWNINGKIGGKFDEEEVQKIKLGSALKTAAGVLVKANQLGLLDEDVDMDEVQKLKLGKVLNGAVKVVKVAGAVGLLEEGSEWISQQSGKDLKDFWGALDKVIDNIKETTGQTKLFDEESFVAPADGKYRPGVFYDEESFVAPTDGKKYPPWIVFDEEQDAIWPPGTGGIKPPRDFIFDEATAPVVVQQRNKFRQQQRKNPQHIKRAQPTEGQVKPTTTRKSLLLKKLQRK